MSDIIIASSVPIVINRDFVYIQMHRIIKMPPAIIKNASCIRKSLNTAFFNPENKIILQFSA